MRFVHTSNWLIGKKRGDFSLLDDQRQFLSQVVAYLDKERPDALLIAGGLFDSPDPSAQAVRLLSDVLTEIVLGLGIRTVVTCGAHDPLPLFSFCSAFAGRAGLHLFSSAKELHPLTMADSFGEILLYPLTASTKPQFYADRLVPNKRSILLASELQAGDLDFCAHFDCVALGADSQAIPSSAVCSSPDWTQGECGVLDVTLGEKDSVVRRVAFLPLHEVVTVRGSYADLLRGDGAGSRDDYLQLILTDRQVPSDAFVQLEKQYPHLLRVSCEGMESKQAPEYGTKELDRADLGELFCAFYETYSGALSEQQRAQISAAEE